MYYAEIMPRLGIFNLLDMKVRTVEDEWFVAYDTHNKFHTVLFGMNDIGKTVFFDRGEALKLVLEEELRYTGDNV